MNRIEAALNRLSLNLNDYDDPRLTPKQCTENLHQTVERRFRQLALKQHPDTKGNHEAMVALIGAKDLLMECEIQRIPKPKPVVDWRYIKFSFGVDIGNGTSSTTMGTGTYTTR